MRVTALLAAVLVVAACAAPAAALDNGLGLTPQMGWNSWNHFACNVSDALLRQTANAMLSTGLVSAGYTYINVDDCWQIARDNATGVIIPDPVRFPNGMAPLIEYIHSLGLKFGLYSDAGTNTCQGRPGSLGYEKIDAQTYAEWGVDYLKYDNCYNENIAPETRYPPMRDALNATGRQIFFSMCEWGEDTPYEWAPKVGNSWRTTGDISDEWISVVSNIDKNDAGWQVAGPGAWNDPDMLEIGNGGLTNDESISHMNLWAITKAPLIIGCDVTTVSSQTVSILSNAAVIAVNQDPLGVQGHKVSNVSGMDVWAGPLSEFEGTQQWAVLLLNRNDPGTGPAQVSFKFTDIGAPATGNFFSRDLWTNEYAGPFTGAYPPVTLNPHQSKMITLTYSPSGEHKKPHRKPKKIILTEQ